MDEEPDQTGGVEPDDVVSMDAIVAALYDAISFEPGGSPDWDRFASPAPG